MFFKISDHINLISIILLLTNCYGEGNPLQEPDFVSGWLYIESTPLNGRQNVNHNLGEMPLFVQVQVTSTTTSNSGYIFPALGLVPRDDDQSDPYGGITYLYNESTVSISAYTMNNNFKGRVVYTENSQYWEGPNSDDSFSGYVRVRAWKESSFPIPDYHNDERISAACAIGTDCLYEKRHGLMEYPSFVIVRTKLQDKNSSFDGHMSDAVGTLVINSGQQNGIVFYGFDREYIRIWTDSSSSAYVFYGADGTTFSALFQSGLLEIFAWTSLSLAPFSIKTIQLGAFSGVAFETDKHFQIPASTEDIVVHLWAEALDGANDGFRFAAGGAMAYSLNLGNFSCSYGGLTYSYTNTSIRTWKPGSANIGKVICVPPIFAGGIYSQSSNLAVAKAYFWIPGVTADHWSCENLEDCYNEHLVSNLLVNAKLSCNDSVPVPVIPEIHRRSRNDSTGSLSNQSHFIQDSNLKTLWYSAHIQNETYTISDVDATPTGTACGSKFQAYINGTHPSLELLTEVPIDLDVCYNDCTAVLTVHVRMCPGGRLQYRLPRIPLIDTAYCLDPHELQGQNVSTLKWACTESRDCFDLHSDCIRGKCQCDDEHYEFEGICQKNILRQQSNETGTNLGLILGLTFGIVLVAILLGIFFLKRMFSKKTQDIGEAAISNSEQPKQMADSSETHG